MSENTDISITKNQTLDLTYYIENITKSELPKSNEIKFVDNENYDEIPDDELKYSNNLLWTPDTEGTYKLKIGNKELSIQVTDIIDDLNEYIFDEEVDGWDYPSRDDYFQKVSFENDYIYAYVSIDDSELRPAPLIRTPVKIDLSGFTTMKIDFEASFRNDGGYHTGNYVTAYATTDWGEEARDTYKTDWGEKNRNDGVSDLSREVRSVDISDINKEVYVGFAPVASAWDGNSSETELWVYDIYFE